MATAFSFAQTVLFSKTSLSLHTNSLISFAFCLPFSSSSAHLVSVKPHSKKWRQQVTSALELGGVKIAKDGTFAKVKLALDNTNGKHVVIKILDKHMVMETNLKNQVLREIRTMKLLNHPNIVRIHEVYISSS